MPHKVQIVFEVEIWANECGPDEREVVELAVGHIREGGGRWLYADVTGNYQGEPEWTHRHQSAPRIKRRQARLAARTP